MMMLKVSFYGPTCHLMWHVLITNVYAEAEKTFLKCKQKQNIARLGKEKDRPDLLQPCMSRVCAEKFPKKEASKSVH